jgi:hypothetical protein
MTVQDQAAPSVVERLRNTFSDWLKHGRELSEMRQLNSTDFCRIANDLRLSPTELEELVRQGPHGADQLSRLLEALGISAQDLAGIEPMVVRDMERVCALCGHKRQCDHDLASGESAERYQEYCLNAPTIVQCGVGVRNERTVEIKRSDRIDLDGYFDEGDE